jgi:hypothetical protein
LPYQSLRQSRFIHAKASEGVPWAEKFVRDADRKPVNRKQIIKSAVVGSKGPRYGGPKNGRKQAIRANLKRGKATGNGIRYLGR